MGGGITEGRGLWIESLSLSESNKEVDAGLGRRGAGSVWVEVRVWPGAEGRTWSGELFLGTTRGGRKDVLGAGRRRGGALSQASVYWWRIRTEKGKAVDCHSWAYLHLHGILWRPASVYAKMIWISNQYSRRGVPFREHFEGTADWTKSFSMLLHVLPVLRDRHYIFLQFWMDSWDCHGLIT